MSMGELVGWTALVLGVLAVVLLFMQNTRLRRIEKQFRALMKGSGATTLTMSLGDIVAAQGERLELTQGQVDALRNTLPGMKDAITGSVACVGLVRFNPFQETGGDQSFALALLDRRGDGVVLSSLHSRTTTRFYAKPIKASASQLSLSDEEMQAIKQAMGSIT